MSKFISSFPLIFVLFAAVPVVEAQQGTKMPRIGYLGSASLSAIPKRIEAFRHGLRELGYVEGKNIVVEWRWAEGKLDRLPDLAAELVRLKVDLIISAGPAVTPPLKEATKTIPIVMAQDNDPVGNGFVASLARPGGNITELATFAPELSGTDRPHDSAARAGKGGSGDQVLSWKTRLVHLALFSFFLSGIFSAEAQQPTKVPRIGFLNAASPSAILARYEAFRQGLQELGYNEGKNIVIEYRYADGKLDRLRELVAELVRLKVAVIVTAGPSATRSAQKATSAIPIVMAFDYDPVGSGLVASLAQPGRNITGLSALYPEMSGKQLELLREMVPGLSRVAVLGSRSQPGNAHALKET